MDMAQAQERRGDAAALADIHRRWHRQSARVCLVLGLGLLAIACIAMLLGDYPASPSEILRSLLSPLTGEQQPGVDFIVFQLRLPRVVLAVLAGAAFGLAGTIFQTLLRNQLASPDIIGISYGASAAAVFCIMVLDLSGVAVGLGALVGALLTLAAIYLLAWRNGISPYKIVLIGIAVGAMTMAFVSYLFTRARISEVQQAMGWLVGSLNGANYEEIGLLAAALVVLVPISLVLGRSLAALELGDDVARAVGSRVDMARVALLATAVGLSAFATAAVGPLAFVAFMSGPIARTAVGSGRGHMGATMLVGALVVLVADLVAQNALPGTQLPAGVVTGLLGALMLMALLIKSNRRGSV